MIYDWFVVHPGMPVSDRFIREEGLYFGFFFFFTCLAFPILISPIARWDKPCLNVAGRNESRRITMNSIHSLGEM